MRIPLKMQNKSLVAEGSVQAIQVEPRVAEGLKAKLSEELEKVVRFQEEKPGYLGRCTPSSEVPNSTAPEITSKVGWKRTHFGQEGRKMVAHGDV